MIQSDLYGANVIFKKLTLAAAVGIALVPLQAAQAQDGGAVGLEEIVVTAERRTTDVQDIPISMSVLTGDQLESKSVSRLDDLPFAAPGLTVTDAGLTQSVNIRGIGLSSGDPDVTNGVGTYIDGLFQPPIVSTLDFFDVNDIQVMRGPQGTFAGANSTGGAIMINSRRPDVDDGISGFVTAGAGNYGSTDLTGALNLPMDDTFAARVAVNKKDRDSYYNSVGTVATEAGSLDEFDYRIGLSWQPVDALDIYFKWEDSSKNSGGYAARPIVTTQFSDGRTADEFDLAYNSPTQNDEDADTLMLEINYQLTDDLSLKIVSGDQDKEIQNLLDTDFSLLAPNTMNQYVLEEQESHEINLISTSDSPLQWVVGGYWQRNDVTVDINNGPFPVEIDIQNYKKIKGIFGQVGYDVSDDVTVEVGLRRAWFDNGVDAGSGVVIGRGIPGFPPTGVQVAVIDGTYDDDAWLGKVSVNWNYDDNNMLYAFISRGAKPGGINSAISTFNTEEVTSYEVGLKGNNDAGNMRYTLNVYYSDYKDFQSNNIDITTGRSDVYNIADATIKGFEASLEAQVGGVLFDASASYVDSKLNPTQPIVNTRTLPAGITLPQCTGGQDPADGLCFEYAPYIASVSGGPNLLAPELSMTFGAEYGINLNSGATLTPRINYAWIDEQWTNFLYNPITDRLQSRGLLSAMVTYEKDDWMVRAWARNLTDKVYVTGQNGQNAEFYGSPRTFGVTATYNF